MLTSNLFIKFQGFHPSDFTRKYLSNTLSTHQDEAPYGANLNAVFTRRDGDFKGVIIIHSAAGRFFASANGRKLKEVTNKLVEQIRKQLGKWKAQRFSTYRY